MLLTFSGDPNYVKSQAELEKMGVLFAEYEIKWGLMTPSSKACVRYFSEEAPNALCQNRSQIARTNSKIFRGTPGIKI